jgi:transcriptional regulator with XRE-family HTH domain
MRHNEGVDSVDIIRQLRGRGFADAELAVRAGLARETLTRWASGAQRPSLETLERVAAAAGAQLEVRILEPDAELLALAGDQLELEPAERLATLLGDDWPRCQQALETIADLEIGCVLIGPVAAALRGAPQRPGDGRVDMLVAPEDAEHAFERLLDVGAWPDGVAASPSGEQRRERWRVRGGVLTVRVTAEAETLLAGSRPLPLDGDHRHALHVPLAEDLLALAERSPWSEDRVYLWGLRAVLANRRYSSRAARAA